MKHKQIASTNEIRMALLVRLPAFKKDVAEIRSSLAIPPNGFEKFEDLEKWRRDQGLFEITLDGFNVDSVGLYGARTDENYSENRLFKLHSAVECLTHKYNLPSHFRKALEDYILINATFLPRENWTLIKGHTRPHTGYATHISVGVYARLSSREKKQMLNELEKSISSFLPPATTLELRERKNFERDIRVWDKLSSRTAHPIKHKIYDSELIERYMRSGAWGRMPSKEQRRILRENRVRIFKGFDQPTSRIVGRPERMTAEAARKAVERINALTKKLFTARVLGMDNNKKG